MAQDQRGADPAKGRLIDLAREKRIRAAVKELGGLAQRNPRLRRRLKGYMRREVAMAEKTMKAFRLEPELIEALDKAAVKLGEEHGGFGPKWSRTDVLRYFVRRGLAELGIEEEAAAKPEPAPTRKGRKGR